MSHSHEKTENLRYELAVNCQLLDGALQNFIQNLEDARKIGVKDAYSFNEMYIMDSLPLRFARISDILTQKILKGIIEYNNEEIYSFISRAKYAEKLGLVRSASILIDIRSLREDIIHEYADPTHVHLIHQVLSLSDALLDMAKNTNDYVNRMLNK